MITYTFNLIFQSRILFGVFRSIKLKFQTSSLLVIGRYLKLESLNY